MTYLILIGAFLLALVGAFSYATIWSPTARACTAQRGHMDQNLECTVRGQDK